MKVHLRQRKQSKNGKISLYLEYYKGSITSPDGKVKKDREYEYLDLYLIDKPKHPIDKEHNKKMLQLAESVKAKRQLEIKNGQHGFRSEFKEDTNFIAYFKKLADSRQESKGNGGNWSSTYKHLVKYAGNKVSFKQVDEDFCNGFKEYLQKTAKKKTGSNLSSASVASYFTKIRACLKEAVKKKIILTNPCIDIETPRIKENKREYLTLDELKAIVKAECRYDVLKRAFLFSCLTGLRWSDIQKMKWSDIQNVNGGWKYTFNQKKTDSLEYLDISEQAKAYLGEHGQPDDRVFIGLNYSDYMNVALLQWMLRAGITKHITFHCARHTFAVLQLSLGTDIYTVSKLLGHKEIKTTQIYANIIDQRKKDAVNKIPDLTI